MDGTSDNPLTGDYEQPVQAEQRIRVEPVRTQHVLRAAEPDDSGIVQTHHRARVRDARSVEDRNQAAQQMMGELRHTLESRTASRASNPAPKRVDRRFAAPCTKRDHEDIQIIRDDF